MTAYEKRKRETAAALKRITDANPELAEKIRALLARAGKAGE